MAFQEKNAIMADSSLLKIRELSRSFGGIRAVDSLSFDVARGEITGLIGPNGAGKTTVFNLITGACQPDRGAGSIRLEGADLLGKHPHEIVRAGVSRTFQNIRLFGRMTCLENAMTPFLARGSSGPLQAFFRASSVRQEEKRAREAAFALLTEMGIAHVADRAASTLPYGFQRKLEIARALTCLTADAPRLLLLDEPAAGMNDVETRELGETIVRVRTNFGVTILLIEHHISLVMAVCSYIVVMDRGRLLAQGTPQAVRDDQRVVAAYLGRRGARGKETEA